jgi:ABC-type transport system involved in Fe-S cluster assembly fused permease/ATPase subunit
MGGALEEDAARRRKKELYVKAPPLLLRLCLALPVLDVIVTALVLFAAGGWAASRVWKEQVSQYEFAASSLELIILCLLRAGWAARCAVRARSGLVTILPGRKIAGPDGYQGTIVLSFLSSLYALVKLGFSLGSPSGGAGAWAVAAASLLFAPTEGLSTWQLRRAIKSITSDTLYDKLNGDGLEAPDVDMDDGPRELTPRQLFYVLKPYFWPKGSDERAFMNRLRSTATWVFIIASKTCSVASPLFLSTATNALYSEDYRAAVQNVCIYSMLALSSKVLKEAQNLVYLKVKQQAYVEIAETTFVHLHSLSLQWHLKKKMGNVIRSMDRGTDAANNLVTYLFLYLVPAIGECVATVILFAVKFKDWKLASMAFVSLAIYGYVTVKITMWRSKFRAQTNKHDNDFHDKATDSIINYETVKYFTAEEYETSRFKDSVRKYQFFSTNVQSSLSVLNISQQVLVSLTLLAGLILAADSVRRDEYSVGDFVSVNTYMVNLFTPLNFLGTVWGVVTQAFVDIKNLSELLAESPDITDAPGAPPLPVPPGSQGISVEFKDISFHYPGQPPTKGLQGVSFTVPAGTTTALVGHTGAGKTSIGRLLFRFYDPVKGQVLLNGHDVNRLQQRSVRAAVGVVPQDTPLFNDTILHNLRYGRQDATMEEVRAAAEYAQILDFILALPEQWETMVGERGLKLSGGERQRISIARCLLKNPPVVLLDEATSALDTRTERSIQDALNSLASNRTTLVIAHRLGTVRNADQIIVLGEGQILERGTHDELLQKEGDYAQMWNMQLKNANRKGGDEERKGDDGESLSPPTTKKAAGSALP